MNFFLLFSLFVNLLPAMEMQHGFILSAEKPFASHLVATGHHSRQVEISAELEIPDAEESRLYQSDRAEREKTHYYVFQAQHLDLETLTSGQVLSGHIIASEIGKYQPQNIIVGEATLHVQAVHLNIANPFFLRKSLPKIEIQHRSNSCSARCFPLTMSSDACSISCQGSRSKCTTSGSGSQCVASCRCLSR